jgi:hypothetical protein
LAYRSVTAAICQRSPKPLNELPQFYIVRCGTLWTVALRRPIFKQNKGSATISLGLNYSSRGSSQSPSRDTVLLCTRISQQNSLL